MQPSAQSPQKNQKTAAINTAPPHKAIIYAASAFGFFICLRWEMLIKIHSYAKAASYHHQSQFGSLSIQQFFIPGSISSAGSFQQAFSPPSSSLPAISGLFRLPACLRLVSVVFSIRSPSALCIALLGALHFYPDLFLS